MPDDPKTQTSGNEETTTTIPEVKDDQDLRAKKESKPPKTNPEKKKTS